LDVSVLSSASTKLNTHRLRDFGLNLVDNPSTRLRGVLDVSVLSSASTKLNTHRLRDFGLNLVDNPSTHYYE